MILLTSEFVQVQEIWVDLFVYVYAVPATRAVSRPGMSGDCHKAKYVIV